jgi:hypothetical protein
LAAFTIDLYVEFDRFCKTRGVQRAILAGAIEASSIARRLDIDSPPRIIVQAHHLKGARESFVLAEFAATDIDAFEAVSTSTKKLGSVLGPDMQVRKAILRVPQVRPSDDDAR